MVDDEPLNVEIITRSLRAKGHEVVGAGSAEAAATALAKGPCDFVLLDHVLPGETGMQSIGRLRALTKAPIYIMSGYSDDDTRQDAMLLGATGFLAKPLDMSALLAALDALPERA